MNKEFVFYTKESNTINATAYGIENIDKAPLVFYIHGFKGFKDWGFVPYTCNYLAENGLCAIAFNFSHNGVGASMTEFDEPDKFARNTVSLEVSELTQLLEAYLFDYFGASSPNAVFFIGHSRGGAVALLTMRKTPLVKGAVLWGSVSHLDRYTEHQKKEWRKKGWTKITNTRTKQEMKLNVSLLVDIEKNKDHSLSIESAIRKIKRPILLMHAQEDLAVPIEEGRELYSWSNHKRTQLIEIPKTGHTFGIVHPFKKSNPAFDNVLLNTMSFITKVTKRLK